ncbi:MAG: DUF3160 domain-containing protein [Candidatus Latescibacterota bacterium]
MYAIESTARRMALLCAGTLVLTAGQATPFDLEAYRAFLESHRDMSPQNLEEMFPAGSFAATAPTDYAAAAYYDSLDDHFALTPGEEELLGRHGFVVTERVRPGSFGQGFLDVYHADLPVFVSTDAVLHALHMSYDAILMSLEEGLLVPRLRTALGLAHGRLAELAQLADPLPEMAPVWRDVDLYLTMPRRLLGEEVQPVFADNREAVRQVLALVVGQVPAEVPLFGQPSRNVDFSQFTPRGHYTQSPELTRYFQAMIWLGRTELYLTPPRGAFPPVSEEAVRHQAAMAAFLLEVLAQSGAETIVAEIDRLLAGLVGAQDNANVPQLRQVLDASGVDSPAALLEPAGYQAFRTALAESGTGEQRILSQILLGDPLSPERLEPAAAFLLLGQRFVVDSYVTGNVVYDQILAHGEPVFRGLPATLDVLFALGNDAALPLLQPELEEYRYATNLAGLRYLIDSFDADFWGGTFYAGWLDAIRSLRPPADRGALPSFMRTAAWWQEKMNTQLAAWAQLRHDNLLYAKQSYTGGVVCSYPSTYVEPIPQFYGAVGRLAAAAADTFAAVFQGGSYSAEYLVGYLREVASIADTLEGIARKELSGEEVDPEEELFLKTVLYDVPEGCAPVYKGWYARLFYTGEQGLLAEDLVVADVHTQPTDESGSPVGRVLHAGTGPLNLAVVVAPCPDGTPTAFAGPVMSYYEHVTLDFDRLTDEEWALAWRQEPSFRPSFTRLYLAGTDGHRLGAGASLPTAVEQTAGPPLPQAPGLALLPGYPNPFNASTLIRFTVGPELAGQRVDLAVYNLAGQAVRQLVGEVLPAGGYSVRWDGTADGGAPVASGVYVLRVCGAGGAEATRRVSLVR